MDWKCVIWQTPLKWCEGHYKLLPFKNIINEEACIWEIKPDCSGLLYEIFNPRAGGKYRTNYESLLWKNWLQKEEKIRLSGYIAQENLKKQYSCFGFINGR